jgi:hypothetical protein
MVNACHMLSCFVFWPEEMDEVDCRDLDGLWIYLWIWQMLPSTTSEGHSNG